MTECRDGCGGCCDPVVLPYTKREYLLQNFDDEVQTDWIVNHLTRIKTSEGLRRRPEYRKRDLTVVSVTGDGEQFEPVFYECDWFDAETRRCTNYDARPATCRDFPWYEGQTAAHREAIVIPAECSFNADIGRPVAEIPVRIR